MRAPLKAIIFDVDGTLAETEEVHRLSFNQAFEQHGLPWRWSVDAYRTLLKVTGGKERILAYAQTPSVTCGPRLEGLDDPLLRDLHGRKTDLYTAAVSAGGVKLREGIPELAAAAHRAGIRLGIATTTSRPNVDALLESNRDALDPALFEVKACGDEVPRKKPAPDIYLLALERLDITAPEALAVEDSANGVEAARRAGIEVAATPSIYTSRDDLSAADIRCADARELMSYLRLGAD